jgi:hypothetical protein
MFLATGSLLLGIVSFFLPVKVNYIRGLLLNGALYESQWHTKAYETVGGFLILLAGIAAFSAAWKYLRGKYGVLQLCGWSIFSGLLLLAVRSTGNTVFFSWVPWIPAEIQHAIGTEYVQMWEAGVANVPMLISSILAVAYVGLTILLGCVNMVTASRRRATSQ